MTANHATGATPSRADRRSHVTAIRLLGLVGVLFFAGLGVGAIVAARGDESAASPASADEGATRLVSAVSGDRFRGNGSHPPPQTSDHEVSEARLTPTVTAARRVNPSVVSIRTSRTVQTRGTLLDRFLGQSGGRREIPGLGSGFAIDDEGHILTNHHVVRDADQIEVMDQGGQRLSAELIGSDELTDLAVIRVPGDRVPPAPLGRSDDLMVGEPAIAIGNPSGFQLQNTEATVTAGVVSGVGRDIQSEGQEVLYADMIQTDAAINPGNSGGPLVNADGEVIGVNSSIFSRSGGSEGLGFAIPVDRALRIAAEIIEFGRVRRPWVGVDIVTERSDSVPPYPFVDRVYEDTPGERAGFRPGDRILTLNGRDVHHDLDWEVGLVDAGVGAVVDVEYRRDGRLETTRLELEEIPSARAERVEVLTGLRLVTVTPQIQSERSLAIEFGALIVDLDADVARNTGLRQGDVIWGINGNEVRSVEEAAQLFEYYARGGRTEGWVRVHIARGTRTGTLRPFRVR